MCGGRLPYTHAPCSRRVSAFAPFWATLGAWVEAQASPRHWRLKGRLYHVAEEAGRRLARAAFRVARTVSADCYFAYFQSQDVACIRHSINTDLVVDVVTLEGHSQSCWLAVSCSPAR